MTADMNSPLPSHLVATTTPSKTPCRSSSPPQSPEEQYFTMDDDSYQSSLYGDSEVDEEDEDHDHGFVSAMPATSKGRNEYEVEFSVYKSLDDAWDLLRLKFKNIKEVTNLNETVAMLLLPYAKWDDERVIELYLDNPSKILDAAGVNEPNKTTSSPPPDAIYHCIIETECLDDDYNPIDLKAADMVFSQCGHSICKSCYARYLAVSISDGKTRLKCPAHNCSRVVPTSAVQSLPAPIMLKYKKLVFEQYMSEGRICKWCPAPGCEHIVRCSCTEKSIGSVPPTVTCRCNHTFCFNCYNPDHRPAPCNIVLPWLKKCKDDSETANWISANTKECPKCRSTIEKNGGCNHMTCRKCRYEFCWMCMGEWSEHGNSWYNCSRYEEKSGSEARDAQARSRQSLQRYLHYYNRYANHEQSAKLDKDFAALTQEKMSQVQVSSGLSWIEVQFLQDASDALQLCRQTLKWTYAFAYYLKRDNQAEIFEDNQKDLELAVESLSRMFEQQPDQLKMMKVDMVDKISYCTRRRHVLLEDTTMRLKTGSWQFDDRYLNPSGEP